jgi:antitoxin (DNA-binding transcriptional repressor) of toxin-antitoxin stability system
MKTVPIYGLKKDLASIIAEAEAGNEVVITRHNKPVARLSRPRSEHLHLGSQFGKSKLKPVVRGKTAGRYLQILQEDRGSDRKDFKK